MISKFCAERDWIRNLAEDPATASNTSVCLTLDLEKDQVRRAAFVRRVPPLSLLLQAVGCVSVIGSATH